MMKYDIMAAAAIMGGLFGYVTAENELVAVFAASAFSIACAFVADWATRPLEKEDEDE